jgi:hypothetical protein
LSKNNTENTSCSSAPSFRRRNSRVRSGAAKTGVPMRKRRAISALARSSTTCAAASRNRFPSRTYSVVMVVILWSGRDCPRGFAPRRSAVVTGSHNDFRRAEERRRSEQRSALTTRPAWSDWKGKPALLPVTRVCETGWSCFAGRAA